MMWARNVSRSTTAAARRGSAKVLAPLRERRVGGDCHRGPLLALGEDLEEQFGSARVEVDVAELVEAEQVEPAVAGDQA